MPRARGFSIGLDRVELPGSGMNGLPRLPRPGPIPHAREGAGSAACAVNHNFPICRAPARLDQKHPGGHLTRPRAADDFPAIRARMEELRRERRARARADDDTRIPDGPRPYAISGRPGSMDRSSGLSPIMRRVLQRTRTV